MQPREKEQDVFGHRIVEKNGDSIIMPANLDPYMKGRALTLIEAHAIMAALTGRSTGELEIPQMFEPTAKQGPELQPTSADTDPSLLAHEAASSMLEMQRQLSASSEQFGLAA